MDLNDHLNAYYKRLAEFTSRYEGKRAQLISDEYQGTTGRFHASEEGLEFRMDHPLPPWTVNYEDSRTGSLNLTHAEEGMFKVVDEDFPIHGGAEFPPRKS